MNEYAGNSQSTLKSPTNKESSPSKLNENLSKWNFTFIRLCICKDTVIDTVLINAEYFRLKAVKVQRLFGIRVINISSENVEATALKFF